MHRLLYRIIATGVLGMLWSSLALAYTSPQCSNEDFEGAYGFTFGGKNFGTKNDYAIIGRFDADGKGSFTGTESQTVNGKVFRGSISGAYSVKPDCTGSAHIMFVETHNEATFDFVLVADGNELYVLDMGGSVELGEVKRQSLRKKK